MVLCACEDFCPRQPFLKIGPGRTPLAGERTAGLAAKLRAQRHLFLVGTVAERVVGSVMAGSEGHRGWINYLAVEPAWRHGFGRRLLARAEELLRQEGCPKVNLLVRQTNAEVVAFYERLGFKVEPIACLGKRLADS
jgi:ribosomal protein S18 acetylase RimI-like enzyme